MHFQIVIACGLVALTTFIHAAAMHMALRVLQRRRVRTWRSGAGIERTLPIVALVLIMFVATAIESVAWAVTYLVLGALSEIETALYFSMVTYTTLGYGDVVMSQDWRILSALEAANGIIMFGWSTALIFAAVQIVYLRPRETGS